MSPESRRACGLLGVMILTAVAALLLRMEVSAVSRKEVPDLERRIPEQFTGWSVDHSAAVGVVSPEIRQALDGLYSAEIARTYADGQGRRVMLVIAYSADQGSEQSQVHRPEVCYTAQGFSIRRVEDKALTHLGSELEVRRLLGERGLRYEPITYWTTMGDRALLPGMERLATRLQLALQRKIPDGFLVRVSTVGLAMPEAFDLQERFIEGLIAAIAPDLRERLTGRKP